MPLFDGTGPVGFGSGNSNGRCRRGVRFSIMPRSIFCNRSHWIWGVVLPVFIAAIRELSNPTGLLRQFTRTLLATTNNKQPIIGKMDYSVFKKRC